MPSSRSAHPARLRVARDRVNREHEDAFKIQRLTRERIHQIRDTYALLMTRPRSRQNQPMVESTVAELEALMKAQDRFNLAFKELEQMETQLMEIDESSVLRGLELTSQEDGTILDSPASPEPELNTSIHEMSQSMLDSPALLEPELNTSMHEMTQSMLESPASPEPELNTSIHEMTQSMLESPASPEPEVNTSIHEMTQSMLESPASPEPEVNTSIHEMTQSMLESPASPEPEVNTSIHEMTQSMLESPASPEPEVNTSIHEMTQSMLELPASPEPELNTSMHEMTQSMLESPASPEPELNTSIHEMTQSMLESNFLHEPELNASKQNCSYIRSSIYDQPISPTHEMDDTDYRFSPDPQEEIITGCPNIKETRNSNWSALSAPLSPIPYMPSFEESNNSFSSVNQPLSPIPHSSSFEESNNDYFSVDFMLSASASSSCHNEDSNSSLSSLHSQASSEASNSGFQVLKHLTLDSMKTPPLGDKVSMLTHMYPHKTRRKIEVIICKITRLTAHFMCGLMSDLLICTCL